MFSISFLEKKMQKYVLAALMSAMAIAGPLGLKVLAMIAGKALVISKVALTIASVIALKKLYSSDHHEEKSFQVDSANDYRRRNMFLVGSHKPTDDAVDTDPYPYYNYNANSIHANNNQFQNY